MKTSWLHATLLPLFLFGSTHSEKNCQCIAIQRVAVHTNASVACPNFTAVEMKFMLHKGPKDIAFFMYGNITHVKDSKFETDISHYVNMTDNTTCFVLHNVTLDKMDLYTCKVEKIYPPPAYHIKEKPQTLVIVENHQCKQNVQKMDPSANHLSLWVGLGFLIIYGLVITVIAISLKSRLRKKKLITHDYMNTNPRARRRRQGILYPAHLTWCRDVNTSTAAVHNKSSSRQMAN